LIVKSRKYIIELEQSDSFLIFICKQLFPFIIPDVADDLFNRKSYIFIPSKYCVLQLLFYIASVTHNQGVAGSSPAGPTMKIRHLHYQFVGVFFFAPDLSQVLDKIGCSHNSFSSFQLQVVCYKFVRAGVVINLIDRIM